MNILDFISSFLSDTQLIYIYKISCSCRHSYSSATRGELDQHKRREQKEEPDFQNKNVFV